MIDFSCRCYHKDRTPIVTDLYIQDYAEAVVRDYRPELLVTPGKVDAFHFLENYLGVTVEFQDIFYPEGKVPVAGATIFNDEAIMVFDRSGMKVSSIDMSAGTVLIDNATMKSESFALRVADWGDPDEEEWKKIIRKAEASGAPLNTLTREDFEALIAIKSITDSGSNAEVRKKNGHLCVYEVERHKAVG